jgi:hypothetical protein
MRPDFKPPVFRRATFAIDEFKQKKDVTGYLTEGAPLWGIHKDARASYWTVTHIPSGCSVTTWCRSFVAAKQFVGALNAACDEAGILADIATDDARLAASRMADVPSVMAVVSSVYSAR